jgi:uncharacterized protein YecE (DUF72 family)
MLYAIITMSRAPDKCHSSLDDRIKFTKEKGKDMADWYLGTMGFGYKDWKGVFYPQGTETADFLGYYSRIFNSVEMDTTFYGTPRAATVEGWAAATPDGFKFCAKTPRIITHELELVGAAGYMQEFTDAIRHLGDKLGVILVQLPPSFDVTHHLALAAFLEELSQTARDIPVAVEFRHRSWFTPESGSETRDLLRSRGVCWAATEYPHTPGVIVPTTDFLYLRWIGQHGTYDHHNFERVDKTSELTRWLQAIREVESRVKRVYGFFNNDYAGFAAGTCNRFKEIAGLPVESFTPPEQGRLF